MFDLAVAQCLVNRGEMFMKPGKHQRSKQRFQDLKTVHSQGPKKGETNTSLNFVGVL